MKPAGNLSAQAAQVRSRVPFAALTLFLILVFLLGGSSKDYVPGLLILRPLAVITLAIGLFSLRREDWLKHRWALCLMTAILALILAHLIPLPPALWMSLPGRELAIAAGEAAGIEQPWRPISLVPYRGWNAFFATVVPAAVLVCALQLGREQHRTLALIALGGAMASALWGTVQAVSGFAGFTFFYGAPRIEVPNGLFANRNHLAALLVCSLPLFVVTAAAAKAQKAAFTITVCAALGALAIMMVLMTGSRAGLVFAIVSAASCLLLWHARPKAAESKKSASRGKSWAPFALGAFGVAALGIFGLVMSQTTGFERLLSAGSGAVEEHRFTVWRTILDFLPAYLPAGTGIGSFVEVFKIHEPDTMLSQSYWNHAHNDWLEWAMEGGVAAIILMVVGVALWTARAVALVRISHLGRIEIQLGLAGVIIVFILGAWSLVDYPLRTPALASLAALCAAWMGLPETSRAAAGSALIAGFGSTSAEPL